MNSQDILDYLDEYFSIRQNGPSFDNANLDFADARLSVFRSERHWCLLFELVWQDVQLSEPSLDIYAYGNCLKEFGFLPEESDIPYLWPEQEYDPHTIDRRHFEILRNGERLSFAPSDEEYAEAGIHFKDGRNGPGSLQPIQQLRFLCQHLNHTFFSSEQHLRRLIHRHNATYVPCVEHTMQLFLQTRHWRHPNLAAGSFENWPGMETIESKPSRIECFHILSEAIASGDKKLWEAQDPLTFNTHWSFW